MTLLAFSPLLVASLCLLLLVLSPSHCVHVNSLQISVDVNADTNPLAAITRRSLRRRSTASADDDAETEKTQLFGVTEAAEAEKIPPKPADSTVPAKKSTIPNKKSAVKPLKTAAAVNKPSNVKSLNYKSKSGKFTSKASLGTNQNGNLNMNNDISYQTSTGGSIGNELSVHGSLNNELIKSNKIQNKAHLAVNLVNNLNGNSQQSGEVNINNRVIDGSGELIQNFNNGEQKMTINGAIRLENNKMKGNGELAIESKDGENSARIRREENGQTTVDGQFDNKKNLKGSGKLVNTPSADGGQALDGEIHYDKKDKNGQRTTINGSGAFSRRNRSNKRDGTAHVDGSHSTNDGNSQSGEVNVNYDNGRLSGNGKGKIVQKIKNGKIVAEGSVQVDAEGKVLTDGSALIKSDDGKNSAQINKNKNGKVSLDSKFDNGNGLTGMANGVMMLQPGGGTTGAISGKAAINWNGAINDEFKGNFNVNGALNKAGNGPIQGNLNARGEITNEDRTNFVNGNYQLNHNGNGNQNQQQWKVSSQLQNKFGANNDIKSTLFGEAEQKGATGVIEHSEKYTLDSEKFKLDLSRTRDNKLSAGGEFGGLSGSAGWNGNAHYNRDLNNNKYDLNGQLNFNGKINDDLNGELNTKFSTTGAGSQQYEVRGALKRADNRGQLSMDLSKEKLLVDGEVRTADKQFGAKGEYRSNRINGQTSFSASLDARTRLGPNAIGFGSGQLSSDPLQRRATVGVMDLSETNKASLALDPQKATLGGHYASGDSRLNVDGELSRRWDNGKFDGRLTADVRQPVAPNLNLVARGQYSTLKSGAIEAGLESDDRNKFIGGGMYNDLAYVRGRYAINDRVDINAGVAKNVRTGEVIGGIGIAAKFEPELNEAEINSADVKAEEVNQADENQAAISRSNVE